MKSHRLLILAAALGAGVVLATPARAQGWTAVEITAPNGSASRPYGINNTGQVVGWYLGPGSGSYRAFITGPNGVGMTDLGAGDGTVGTAINNAGQAVVSPLGGANGPGYITGPNGVGLTALGFLPQPTADATNSPNAINNSGQVAGACYGSNGGVRPPDYRGFITGGNGVGMTDLGWLESQYYVTLPYGINDAGQVVGGYSYSGEWTKAFMTDANGAGIHPLQSVIMVPYSSAALAINNAGQVTGWAGVDPNGWHYAFVTGPNGVGMTNLGSLGGVAPWGDVSTGFGINSAGVVVGSSFVAGGGTHAFIAGLNGAGMIDLNSLVTQSHPDSLTAAYGINDKGQVIAEGYQGRAYLLTPPLAPSITTQPTTQTVAAGATTSFTVAAFGNPTPTYQWQVSTNGGNTWANLTDTAPYSGTATGTLTITGATVAMNSFQYQCLASNSVQNNVASSAVTLTVNQGVPEITWFAPSAITAGTALSATQLNAEASVAGTFVYTPAAGTVLNAGSQTLSVTFTPTDTTDYTTVTKTQTLAVISANYAGFLQKLFPLVLGRQIDTGGLSAYVAAMSNGHTRSQVYGDLLGSSEYSALQIEPAIRLYSAALARSPDYAGLQNWSNALHAGVLTLTGAADQFAGSTEFGLKYGSLDNTGYVQQLYRNVLGREADSSGLADWVGQLNAGASRGTILVGFSESDEFKANLANQVETVRLYYLLEQRMPTAAELQSWIGFLKGYDQTNTLLAQGYPSGLSDSAYVQAVFRGFLRREADAGTLDTFGAALAAGTVTHGSLVETAMNSTEFNLFVAPVSRLYLAALRRVPDAGGLDNWVAYVRGGNSLQVMADAFAASQEFTNRYGAMSNHDYVAQLYRDVLGREADPAGLASWTALLDAGSTTRGQILIGFSESQEAIHLFAPTLRTFLHYFTFLNATPTQQDLDYWNNYLTTLTNQFRQTFLAAPSA